MRQNVDDGCQNKCRRWFLKIGGSVPLLPGQEQGHCALGGTCLRLPVELSNLNLTEGELGVLYVVASK